MALFLKTIFVLCSCSVLLADQSFTEISRNTTVLQGEDVTLKCTVKNQKGEVFWCRDESFCVYTRKRNMTDPRLSFGGNETLGENHLVIKNASLSDDTKYQCQVLATDKEPGIKSDWAFLTVLIRPSSIAITPNSKDDDTTIRLVVNQTASIECLVEDSNPGCDIAWYLDSKELVKTNPEVFGIYTYIKKLPSKLYKTTSKIILKPKTMEEWYSKYLKCECQNAFTTRTFSSVYDSKIIIFNYAPKVSIVKISKEDITAGSFIQFECVSDSKPPVNNYKWYIDDKVYLTGTDEKHLFLKIEESMHKKNLNCDAKNDVSTQTGSYQIQLLYGPKIRQELPSHKIVNVGDYLSLTCDVDSNPESSVIWTFNETVIFYYPKLIISSFKKENYGIYKCIASLRDYPRVYSKTIILPPGPPIIQSEPVQFTYYGHPGSIQCIFEKEPKPEQIDWFKGNHRIDFDKEKKYQLKSEILERKGTRSVLLFRDVSESDFGNYSCRGLNHYGSSSFNIKLEPKEKEVSNLLSVFVIFMFLFISGIVLGFFSYVKFTSSQSLKKSKRKRSSIREEYFKSKPSLILDGRHLSYPNVYRKPSQNFLKRLSNQNECTTRCSQSFQPINEYTDIGEARKMSQYEGHNLDMNLFDYEMTDLEPSPSLSGKKSIVETSETSFINPIDGEYNYLNSAHYQTDV